MATPLPDDESNRRVELKILSPSAEANQGLRFVDLLLSTTIAELKIKIQDSLPTHPPLERLRLIYLGRASRDTETLLEVLGRNVLQQDSPHVIHLVISDTHSLPHTRGPRSSSVPPNPRAHASRQPLALPTAQHASLRNATHPLAQQQLRPQAHQQVVIHGRIQALQGHMQAMNPQEVVNNLLNQHLAAHGQLPQTPQPGFINPQAPQLQPVAGLQQPVDLALQGSMQQQNQTLPPRMMEQQQMPQMQNGPLNGGTPPNGLNMPTSRPSSESSPSSAVNQRTGQGIGLAVNGTHTPNTESMTEGRPGSLTPQGSGTNTPSGLRAAPNFWDQNMTSASPTSGTGPNHPSVNTTTNVAHVQAASGVTPQGQRWTMTLQAGFSPLNQPQGASPLVAPQPQFQGQTAFPLMQPSAAGMGGMTPTRSGSSPAGQPQFGAFQNHPNLSRSGTPVPGLAASLGARPISPARPVSEGHYGPALATMRSHLDIVRRSVETLGRTVRIAYESNQIHGRSAEPGQSSNIVRAATELDQSLHHFDNNYATFLARWPQLRNDENAVQIQILRQAIQASLAQLWDVIRLDGTLRPRLNAQEVPQEHATLSSTQTAADATATAPHTPQVYVVTDAAGQPQALLVGPLGQYITTHLPADIHSTLLSSQLPADQLAHGFNQLLREVYLSTVTGQRHHHHPQRVVNGTQTRSNNQPTQRTQNAPAQGNIHPPAQGGAPNAAQVAVPVAVQRGQARAPDEMRDLLAPIVRNLWLIIRVAGLFYFILGGGRISWRPLLLCAVCVLVYGAQAGLFGNRLDVLRRYLDRVVGAEPRVRADQNGRPGRQIAGLEQQDRDGNDQRQMERPDGSNEPAMGANVLGDMQPEDIARRLVQERARQDSTWISRQLQNVERTAALFVASLWPGIGEQAVRLQTEREEQEAQARRQAEELAEQKQREKEQQQKEREGSTADIKDGLDSEALAASTAESSSMAAARTSGSDTVREDSDVSRVNDGKRKAADEEAE